MYTHTFTYFILFLDVLYPPSSFQSPWKFEMGCMHTWLRWYHLTKFIMNTLFLFFPFFPFVLVETITLHICTWDEIFRNSGPSVPFLKLAFFSYVASRLNELQKKGRRGKSRNRRQKIIGEKGVIHSLVLHRFSSARNFWLIRSTNGDTTNDR